MRLASAVLALALSTSAAAFDQASLSKDVQPCADFDAFVNGTWLAATTLPADRGSVDAFSELRRVNDALLDRALRELIAQPAQQTTPGLKLLARYYASGMDEAAIEARGLRSLAPLLDRIAALKARDELPALLALLDRSSVAAPLASNVDADRKDARRHALHLAQAGLGLPDRDDYFRSDERTRRLQAAYRRYAQALLGAAGQPVTEAELEALMAFETRLAEASRDRVGLRDPQARYNPFSPTELAAAAPGLDWAAYLGTLAAPARPPQRLIVGTPAFATRVAEMAASEPMGTWQRYLTLRVLDAAAGRLPKAYAQAEFEYRARVQGGLQAPPPRSEQVILQIGGRIGREPLGMALGELFVAKAFSPEAQRRSLLLVDDIRASMKSRIEKLDWMSPATQTQALDKLAQMRVKIGAPEVWSSYEGLVMDVSDYAGNWLRAAQWQAERQMHDLDQPVDRSRWRTSPHIVNAFAGGLNEITFPAGILQPPFFSASADDAVNYGGIGMVIGHEITHHFDDGGRQFDALGNLRDWWTPADTAAYQARANRVADRYAAISPLPGHAINGRQTLGENISDLGGMAIAYEGLQLALARSGQTAPIEGFTPAQRFFIGNALIWRAKWRTERLIQQLRSGTHSPNRYRILTPMANTPYFAQAFACKAGDVMVAADPLRVW
jgi:putative endopeptidase